MADIKPTTVNDINIGWDPSLLPTSSNDTENHIERYRDIKTDANDYSRFNHITDDSDEENETKSSNKSNKETPIDKCRNCHKVGAKLKCSICKKATYCARKCQASDWQFHKRICKKPEENKPKEPEKPKQTTDSNSNTKKSSPSSAKKPNKSSKEVVLNDPDLPANSLDDMRGYKNGLPYFHRELSSEEKNLIGDIAPKKVQAHEPIHPTAQAAGEGSAWNAAGTFEERLRTKWAEEKWNEIYTGVTFTSKLNQITATFSAPEKMTGDASICIVRGTKRYLFDFTFTLPIEISMNGKKLKGKIEMRDISNDEDYEISIPSPAVLDKKSVLSTSLRSELKKFLDEELRNELLRLIDTFVKTFQKE